MLNLKKNNQTWSVLVASWETETTRDWARIPGCCCHCCCWTRLMLGWVTACELFNSCTWHYSKSPTYWLGIIEQRCNVHCINARGVGAVILQHLLHPFGSAVSVMFESCWPSNEFLFHQCYSKTSWTTLGLQHQTKINKIIPFSVYVMHVDENLQLVTTPCNSGRTLREVQW